MLAIVATLGDGTPAVRVLPITHRLPSDLSDAIEIPPATKRRLGLDEERSWIVLTESDFFVWPGPDVRAVDNESGCHRPLPPARFEGVRRRLVELAKSRRHKATLRSD